MIHKRDQFSWPCKVWGCLLGAALLMPWAPALALNETRSRKESAFDYPSQPERPRATFMPALFSLILPGFDQWQEGQIGYGAAYSGLALFGLGYASAFSERASNAGEPGLDQPRPVAPDEFNRRVQWGSQLTLVAGSLSAYHSFRSAARTHRPNGDYAFLGRDESPAEIMLAPFRFDFLTRTTTLLPLGLIAGLYAYTMSTEQDGVVRDPLTNSDAFFASALSYGAGTGEEAAFRGWLMPELRQVTGSDFWSNSITATIFALAHLSTIDVPVVQLGLGYYLGHVTQRNRWRIAESVFIHTWWDVFAFLMIFQTSEKAERDARQAVHKKPPTVLLPIWDAPL